MARNKKEKAEIIVRIEKLPEPSFNMDANGNPFWSTDPSDHKEESGPQLSHGSYPTLGFKKSKPFDFDDVET